MVSKKVIKRWDALIAGKYEDAYQMLSPGMKNIITPHAYAVKVSGRTVQWKKVEVVSATCDDAACAVRIKLSYLYYGSVKTMLGKQMDAYLNENWIKKEGGWWFVPDD